MIKLPKPPSTNSLYAGKSRRYKSAKYKAWLAEASFALMKQDRSYMPGTVILDITVRRDRKNEDISNRIKALEDFCVSEHLMDDDKKVQEVRARWGDVEGCEVRITPFGIGNEAFLNYGAEVGRRSPRTRKGTVAAR